MEKKKTGVSRQTLWQRKHRALGLCVVCSQPAYKGWRCVKHYEQHKIVMRLRYIPKVRGRYDVGGVVGVPRGRRARRQEGRRPSHQGRQADLGQLLIAGAKGEHLRSRRAPKKRKTTRAKAPRSRKASH